ncbi:N-acetylmuramoyl-L-alanine amidase [Deinococcus lacus]|uniref:N-acetylmuramoyl-L-alanine amidase n=1 Tax=Deinococcus lacus TaxID=392561 RepID=A0ABW1YEP4_9DEIO
MAAGWAGAEGFRHCKPQGADGRRVSAQAPGRFSLTGRGAQVATVSAPDLGMGIGYLGTAWSVAASGDTFLFPKQGILALATGQEGSETFLQVPGAPELTAPSASLTLSTASAGLPITPVLGLTETQSDRHQELRIGLLRPVPFTLTEERGGLTLRLFGASGGDSARTALQGGPARSAGWAALVGGTELRLETGTLLGYSAQYRPGPQGTELLLQLRRPQPLGNPPLAGQHIVLDAGHGGDELGGAGPLRIPEKDLVLPLTLRIAQLLRAQGAQVTLTRDRDIKVPLYQRPLLAEQLGADLLVSIHANALPDGIDPRTRRGPAPTTLTLRRCPWLRLFRGAWWPLYRSREMTGCIRRTWL